MRRAFLFTLWVVCFLGLVLALRTTRAQQAPTLKLQPSPAVKAWNDFAASIARENETLRELNDSLQRIHPDRGLDARRLELYTAAILEHEKQLILLRAMRKAEFGKAGDNREGAMRVDSHADSNTETPF